MLSFKQYLVENMASNDEDHEYCNLCDMYSHALESNNKELIKHMVENANSGNLTEVVNPDVDEKVKKQHIDMLNRLKDATGEDYGSPLNIAEAGKVAYNAVSEHYKKSPQEQQSQLESDAKLIGHVIYGDKSMTPDKMATVIKAESGNKKTGMNVKHPLVTRAGGKKVINNFGFGGNPVSYTAYNNVEDLQKNWNSGGDEVNKCPHKTKSCGEGHIIQNEDGTTTTISPACLAKSGGYRFAKTVAKLHRSDFATHSKTLSAAKARLIAHALRISAEHAAKKGGVIDVRSQVSDQGGYYVNGVVGALKDSNLGVGQHIHQYDYNKDPKQIVKDLEAAKDRGDALTSRSFSHPGPLSYTDTTGKTVVNNSNIQKHGNILDAYLGAKKKGLDPTNTQLKFYMVRGGIATDESGKEIDGVIHKQPKSNGRQVQKDEYRRTDSLHGQTRLYGTDARHGVREHVEGEPEESFDSTTGTGHTTVEQTEQNGSKRKIHVPFWQFDTNKKDGVHVTPENRSDGAAGGIGHSIVQASSAVASTSGHGANGQYPNSLMHRMNDPDLFDRNTGILHVGNPKTLVKGGHLYLQKEMKKIPIFPR